MSAALQVAGAVLAGFVPSVLLTRLVLALLRRRGILDRPNERSSHAVPTPRGGGLAIMATTLPLWALLALLGATTPAPLSAVAAALGLALVSWWDDRAGLSPGLRLLVQAFAVAAGLAALPGAGTVFQGLLPPILDILATALLWLWFVNLFNFMDGIDGIAGSEAAAIGLGIALVALLLPDTIGLGAGLLGASLAGAALGFLVWNWHPAKLFMGDVGSVPLGYLLGWLLLALAAAGLWATALVLPLYFLADASWTLARRARRGERLWQAHREHFYQRAVRRGLSHAAVVRRVVAADLALVALAVAAALEPAGAVPLAALAAACGVVLALLRALAGPAPAA